MGSIASIAASPAITGNGGQARTRRSSPGLPGYLPAAALLALYSLSSCTQADLLKKRTGVPSKDQEPDAR